MLITDIIFLAAAGLMGVSALFVELFYMGWMIKYKASFERAGFGWYAALSFWLTNLLLVGFWLTSAKELDVYIHSFFYGYLGCYALLTVSSLILAFVCKKKNKSNDVFKIFRGNIIKLIIIAVLFWFLY